MLSGWTSRGNRFKPFTARTRERRSGLIWSIAYSPAGWCVVSTTKTKRALAGFFICLLVVGTLLVTTRSDTSGAATTGADGTDTPATAQTNVDPDALVQQFYIGTPGACYGSNINCFVNDNGSRIQNLTVTANLGSPFRVTSSRIRAISPCRSMPIPQMVIRLRTCSG